MYKRLHFKIVLIFAVFIFSVMSVIGTILLNNVFSYYTNDFVNQLDSFFDQEHIDILKESFQSENYVESLKDKLNAYSGLLGIDVYRNFYILDKNGEFLDGNVDMTDANILKTQNLVSAINGKSATRQYPGAAVMDYALRLENSEKCAIIYIADTQEEMHDLAWIIFSIILQALFVGIIIALILSFLLAKAITSPIQKITATATRIAEGDFSQNLTVYSRDEIGVLSETFNSMARELKSNLDEITGEREKLSTIFSYLKDGVIAFDSHGKILHINQTAIDLLKEDYNENITLPSFIKLLCIDYSQSKMINDTHGGDGKVFYDVKFKERVIDVNFGSFTFELSGEPYTGYISVMHDITEHFELELARREFVANVSHELRTPLTGIKGAAETIIENDDMPDNLKSHFLEMIITESDRMTRIVRDLLMLSRLDNNKVSWKISSFSLVELVRNRVEIMLREAMEHNHILKIDSVQENMPNITADRERIDQVVTNIIQNAIKYTPDSGKILIALGHENIKKSTFLKDGFYSVIRVKDNGMGIPQEDLPHIFERFYRVEKARSSEKGGTGLGLSISKEIIVSHGGDITIASKPDDGTSVTIYLPDICAIEE